MKRLTYVVFCLGVIGLVACGKRNQAEVPEGANGSTLEQENNIQEKKRPDIIISKKGYDDFWVISDQYILFLEDGKYGVIDYEENEIIPAEYDFGNNLYAQSMVILGNYTDEGYDCSLFDKDMQLIFQNTQYPQYTIASVSEGVLHLVNKELSSSIYLDLENEHKELFRLSEDEVEGYYGSTGYSGGYVLICTNTYHDEGFPNLMDKQGNITFLRQNGYMYYTYISYAIGEDGWILCYQVDMEHPEQFENGFYNVDTRQFVALPEDKTYVKQVRGKDGIYHATYENYAIISQSVETDEYYVFDIMEQHIINSDPYGYVELNDYGKPNILYATLDNEKWGYLNEKFEPTTFLYEDASSFDEQGYAWIYQDGEEYLIDQDGEILSDAYQGQEVSHDYGLFKLKNEDKKYFVRIE